MQRPRYRLAGALVALAVLAGCSPTSPQAAPATPTPSVTGTVLLGARTVDVTVQSPAVGSAVAVRLILPTRYAAEPDRRWPVLYLLHGAPGSHEDWEQNTDVAELTKDAGVIVAMPFGGRAGFYSDWLKGPKWETFHTGELPAVLAASYHASTKAAVAGLSMGGLGALAYAARHPGQYAAAASFSGVVHTRLSSGTQFGYRDLVQSQGEDPNALWGDITANADVWAAHNPFDLAPQLKGVKIFVSCGDGLPGPLDPANRLPDGNENAVAEQNVAFVKHLEELGVPAQVELYGHGTHSWPYWQRELHNAWPMLSAAMGI